MEEIYERCCALDVHHASVSACVCVPDRSGKRSELRGRFSTMTSDWVWSFEPADRRHELRVPGLPPAPVAHDRRRQCAAVTKR
jgi:hypothetical protein